MSQPAFAYANPTVIGSPTIVVTSSGGKGATITITGVPMAVCPASLTAPPPAPVQVSLTWQALSPPTVLASGSGPNVSYSGGSSWRSGDLIRVTVVYRYQCIYSGGTSQACFSWFREFITAGNGGGSVWTVNASSGPTSVACPP